MTNQEMSTQTPDILLRLTNEELAGLLQIANVKSLPSFVAEKSLNEGELTFILNTLRARELLEIDTDGNLRANAAMMRFIEVAISAERFLIFRSNVDTFEISNWFYFGETASILHTNSGDGMQNFRSISTPDTLAGLIATSLFFAEESETVGTTVEMPKTEYDRLRNLAKTDLQQAYQDGQTYDSDTLQAILEPTISHVISYTEVQDGNIVPVDNFAVLGIDNHYWMVEITGSQTVHIVPALPTDILERIAENAG